MRKRQNRLLIVGNWKMNPGTLGEARKLFLDASKAMGRHKPTVDVVVAPPFPFISEMERLSPSQRIMLAAQDVHHEKDGAHTGEVSLSMLKSVGVGHVIIGHSERRAAGETDSEIYDNTQAVLKGKEIAIVCVGEKEHDNQGHYFGVVEAQLKSAIVGVKASQLSSLVIAYEPVWAIGTGKNATAEDAHEMKLFIQKILSDHFSRAAMKKVRILYGGSVKAENADELLKAGDIDGFLIGGASLRAKEFAEIVKIAEKYEKEITKR